MNLAGKIALVTGAARGLGRGIADALAAEGVHLALADLGVAEDPAMPYRLARPADLEETHRLVSARGVPATRAGVGWSGRGHACRGSHRPTSGRGSSCTSSRGKRRATGR